MNINKYTERAREKRKQGVEYKQRTVMRLSFAPTEMSGKYFRENSSLRISTGSNNECQSMREISITLKLYSIFTRGNVPLPLYVIIETHIVWSVKFALIKKPCSSSEFFCWVEFCKFCKYSRHLFLSFFRNPITWFRMGKKILPESSERDREYSKEKIISTDWGWTKKASIGSTIKATRNTQKSDISQSEIQKMSAEGTCLTPSNSSHIHVQPSTRARISNLKMTWASVYSQVKLVETGVGIDTLLSQ